MIQIDKNVPIPASRNHKARYQWDRMEVGDSFFVSNTSAARLWNAAYGWGKRHSVKFQVEPEKDGARVWRIE